MADDGRTYPAIVIGIQDIKSEDGPQAVVYFLDRKFIHCAARSIVKHRAFANGPTGELVISAHPSEFVQFCVKCDICKQMRVNVPYNKKGVVDLKAGPTTVCILCCLKKQGNITFEGKVDVKPIEQAVLANDKTEPVSNKEFHVVKIYTNNLTYIGMTNADEVVYTDYGIEPLSKDTMSRLQHRRAFVDVDGGVMATLDPNDGPYSEECKDCGKLAMAVKCSKFKKYGFAVGDVNQFKQKGDDGFLCVKCQGNHHNSSKKGAASKPSKQRQLTKKSTTSPRQKGQSNCYKSSKKGTVNKPGQNHQLKSTSTTGSERTLLKQGYKNIAESVNSHLEQHNGIGVTMHDITVYDYKCMKVLNIFLEDIWSMGATLDKVPTTDSCSVRFMDEYRWHLPEYLEDGIVAIDYKSPQYLLYTIFKLVKESVGEELETYPKCKAFIQDTIGALSAWHTQQHKEINDTDEYKSFGPFRGYFLETKGPRSS